MLKPWILAGLGLPGSRGTSLVTQASAGSSRRYRRLDAAGTSNSTNVRLTRQKSTLFQWLAVPLWFPTGKDSVPTDSGAFHSQFCAREIVNAVLIVGGVAFENAGRLRSRLRAHWLVYELTHRAPRSRRAAGSRSTQIGRAS